LDEYEVKFSARPIRLGTVWMDKYKLQYGNYDQEVNQFYQKFFRVDESDRSVVMAKYTEGLVWVWDYYFNSIDSTKADIWYYPYNNSPLLTDVVAWLETQPSTWIESQQQLHKSWLVELADWFNPVEHMMWVSPVVMYPEIVPLEYKSIVKTSPVYEAIQLILNDVKQSKISRYICCTGVHFLNKCHIISPSLCLGLDMNREYRGVLEFITSLRKVHNFLVRPQEVVSQ